jgi:hypothetical protein
VAVGDGQIVQLQPGDKEAIIRELFLRPLFTLRTETGTLLVVIYSRLGVIPPRRDGEQAAAAVDLVREPAFGIESQEAFRIDHP